MVTWLVLWIVIAVLAAIGELLTTGLFLASIAVAAVVAALVAIVLPVALQVVIFAALALGGIALVRPIALHALGMDRSDGHISGSTTSYLVGRRGIVTRTVDSSGGQIRIGEGEFWTARAFNDDDVIEPGTRVEILLVDGLTALVAPVSPPSISPHSDQPNQKGSLSWNP